MSERLEESLQLQAHVLESVAVGTDLPSCLSELCSLVEGMVPDSVCSVMLLDEESGALNVVAAPSVGQEVIDLLDGLVPCALAGSCGTAVHLKQAVYVGDTLSDPRWEPLRHIARDFGIRACWSVPIFSRTGDVLGSFAISHLKSRDPSELHRSVLKTSSHLAGIAIDRDRQDAQLRASEQKYQDLFENAPDLFVSVDVDSKRVVACNRTAACTLGFERSEILGREVQELFDPSCHEEMQRVFERFLATGEGSSEELRLRCKDGRSIDVGLRISAVRDEQGRIRRCRSILRDITDLKRAEQAVRQTQKLESVGVLASGIAHDFNNLLVGILGNAEVALEAAPAESANRQAIESIQRASQRAADLTRQLLHYAGRGQVCIEPMNLNELVEEMAGLLSSTTQVPMDLSLAESAPWITGDATQIRQVLMNLLTNAADAVGEGAEPIVARTGVERADRSLLRTCITGHDLPAGDYAFVEIADRGCGMDEATVARIFDPFFSTKSSGRGLGLAATLGIVTGHNGTLLVDSSPGEGTTFRFLCPRAEACETVEAPLPRSERSIAGARVLVVDDEASVVSVLEQMLSQAGCFVASAPGGEQALAAARRDERLDAVILDVTMPRMSGRETFEALRALRPGLPVVFCSGQSPEDYADLVDATSATACLPKPFTGALLRSALAGLLERRAPSPSPSSAESG